MRILLLTREVNNFLNNLFALEAVLKICQLKVKNLTLDSRLTMCFRIISLGGVGINSPCDIFRKQLPQLGSLK